MANPLVWIVRGDLTPEQHQASSVETDAFKSSIGREDRCSSPHQSLFFHWESRSALRVGRYKILRNKESEPFALYVLQTDLAETHGLAAKQPEVLARMQRLFEYWQAKIATAH